MTSLGREFLPSCTDLWFYSFYRRVGSSYAIYLDHKHLHFTITRQAWYFVRNVMIKSQFGWYNRCSTRLDRSNAASFVLKTTFIPLLWLFTMKHENGNWFIFIAYIWVCVHNTTNHDRSIYYPWRRNKLTFIHDCICLSTGVPSIVLSVGLILCSDSRMVNASEKSKSDYIHEIKNPMKIHRYMILISIDIRDSARFVCLRWLCLGLGSLPMC